MPPQWNESLMRLTLRGGSVYYLQHHSLTSPEPHYFVILNLDPQGDKFLVVLVASSKVEKVKRINKNLPATTLVEIEPSEYNEFNKPSIINCNHYFRFSRQELLQKLQQNIAHEKSPVPTDLLKKLRAGIVASPLVEAEIKDMVQSYE